MTSCTKSKRTSSPDAPAKCRDVENASAFETRSAPNLARCYPRSLPSISEIPCLDSGTSSIDYRLMSNVSREKSFNSGCVIRSTRQCNSNRLSATSGRYESEIITARWHRSTAISSSGFGLAPTKNTTTSSGNCGSWLAIRASSRPTHRSPRESL